MEYARRRRRRRSRNPVRVLILRAGILLLVILCVFLMICGCLYLAEHLFARTDEAPPPENIGTGQEEPAGDAVTVPEVKLPSAAVVLDAGHGGVQPGCAFDNVLEKDVTLPVTLLVRDKLEEMGFTVALTRDSDENVSLAERAEFANGTGAYCFVSIHCNAFEQDTSVHGLEVYYYQSEEGRQLSDAILAAAEEDPAIDTRYAKEENYYVIRETEMPSALVEIGYLSNPAERAALTGESYQDTVASAIAAGIAAWLDDM